MRIGVVEDDTDLIELYKFWFSAAQYDCVFFKSVAGFNAAVGHEKFDLLLIDMILPDGSGTTVLQWVRENIGWDLPVMIITVRDTEADIVSALRMGADDYIIKPPKRSELLARIDGLMRRSNWSQQSVMKFGRYEVSIDNREILLDGVVIGLTQKEFELAYYLFQNPGRLLSRVHLLEMIWGLEAEVDTRTVDTHISRVRRKLDICPANGWEILTIYGYGYRMEAVSIE